MGPVVVLKSYDKFEDAVDMAIRNMEEDGGTGHTAGIYSNDEDHILYFGEKIPVARVLVNQPTPDAWGPETNALDVYKRQDCDHARLYKGYGLPLFDYSSDHDQYFRHGDP